MRSFVLSQLMWHFKGAMEWKQHFYTVNDLTLHPTFITNFVRKLQLDKFFQMTIYQSILFLILMVNEWLTYSIQL